jgi:branched-chain amino acid transport system permease protein
VIGAAALIMALVELFRRRSIWGKAATAVAADKDAAALMGINVPLVITLSFVLSSAIAGVSGVLVAPLTLASATMGTLLGTKAYAVAIVGGLQSGLGVLVGGLLLGLSEQFTARYVSTGYKDTPGFVLLILILLIKPSGLFGKKTIKKV